MSKVKTLWLTEKDDLRVALCKVVEVLEGHSKDTVDNLYVVELGRFLSTNESFVRKRAPEVQTSPQDPPAFHRRS